MATLVGYIAKRWFGQMMVNKYTWRRWGIYRCTQQNTRHREPPYKRHTNQRRQLLSERASLSKRQKRIILLCRIFVAAVALAIGRYRWRDGRACACRD